MNTEEKPPIIDWPSQLTAWRESGLPMTRYCQQQGLVTHQLSYHKRKQDAQKKSATLKPSGFAQIDIVGKHSAEDLILRIGDGLAIEGITSHNLAAAISLARALS